MNLSWYWICVYGVIFNLVSGWLVLFDIKIGYGRLVSSFIKVYLPPKFAWFVFQIPNLLWAAYFIFYVNQMPSIAYCLFILHYINRSIIYPLTLKTTTKVPLEIVSMAFIFTTFNGFLQGTANSKFQMPHLSLVVAGLTLYIIGLAINIHSDNILQKAKEKMNKQKTDDNIKAKYQRIDQFLFKYLSNPNYFGEVIQWFGYALVSSTPQAFLFAFSTLSILTPAAISRNQWNKKNIQNYPPERKAIIPFIV